MNVAEMVEVARRSLTSVIGRELVLSTRYGRKIIVVTLICNEEGYGLKVKKKSGLDEK